MSTIHVNDDTFRRDVLSSELPVLVDFWAPWCGPCRAMGGVVDEVAGDLAGQARVVKVNVDEAQQTAQAYGIQSIPTFAIVENGEVVDQFSGVVPKSQLLNALRAHVT